MKKIIIGLFFLFIKSFSSAQEGYEITINIKNFNDTVMYLAFYQFDILPLADTCKNIVNGKVVFKGPKTLDRGMYFLVNQNKEKCFDFFISNTNQKMIMSADKNDWVNSLKCSTHKENEDFFRYIKFMTTKNIEFTEQCAKSKEMPSKDSIAFINEKTKQFYEVMLSYEKSVFETHKGTFFGDIINLRTEKNAIDIPMASNGRPDSNFKYNYYKNHYWDNVNFKDDGMIRTLFFADKMKKYFSNVIIQNPDTVIIEIDRIMSKTKVGSMMQKLLLVHFLITTESSKIMSFDKVFVHIIKKYIKAGLANGMYDNKTIEKIIDRGRILEPITIGSIGPDLFMIDTTGNKTLVKIGFDTVKTTLAANKLYSDNAQKLASTFVSLHSIKADYLVLVFWDVDCGHCKIEIPKLLNEYHALQKENYNIKVFSVYTKHEFSKYKQYILDNKLDWINVYDGINANNITEKYDIFSTPVLYLLDKNKRIKAKRFSVEQLKEIVKQMEREYKFDKK